MHEITIYLSGGHEVSAKCTNKDTAEELASKIMSEIDNLEPANILLNDTDKRCCIFRKENIVGVKVTYLYDEDEDAE